MNQNEINDYLDKIKNTAYNKCNDLILDFKAANENIKNNKEIALTLLEKTDKFYPYIGEKLKNDRDFNLEIIKKNGWLLEHFNDNFKEDKEIVSAAIEADKTGIAFYYASDKLKDDKELIKEAVKQGFDNILNLSENIQNDYHFMLDLVNIYGFIAVCGDKNKNNKEMILAGINKQPNIFKYCYENMRNNYSIALLAIEKDIKNIEYLGSQLKQEIGDQNIVSYLQKAVLREKLETMAKDLPLHNTTVKKMKI